MNLQMKTPFEKIILDYSIYAIKSEHISIDIKSKVVKKAVLKRIIACLCREREVVNKDDEQLINSCIKQLIENNLKLIGLNKLTSY